MSIEKNQLQSGHTIRFYNAQGFEIVDPAGNYSMTLLARIAEDTTAYNKLLRETAETSSEK